MFFIIFSLIVLILKKKLKTYIEHPITGCSIWSINYNVGLPGINSPGFKNTE